MVNRLGRFHLHQAKSLSIWVLVQHRVGDAITFFIPPDLGKMQHLVQSLNHEHLNNIQRLIDLRTMPPSFSCGFFLLIGSCCLLPSTQTKDPQDTDHDDLGIDTYQCRKVAFTISNASSSLFKELAQRSKYKNILFSPLRIAAAFTMLSLGAKGNTSQQILEGLRLNFTGLTEAEIHKCFQYLFTAPYESKNKSPLFGGSSLFISKDLNVTDKFVKNVKQLYQCETIPTDFTNSQRAKEQINNHMNQKTQRELQEMIVDLEKNISLAVMDYIIFHGKWYNRLRCQHVVMEDFLLDERVTIKVPTINHLDIVDLLWVEDMSSKVLQYGSMGSAMAFFILPDEGKMQQVEQTLTYPQLRWIRAKMKSVRLVKIHMPELSVTETYDLEPLMSIQGITQVFSDSADLSGITGGAAPLKLSKTIHKAFLTLDTEGTGPPDTNYCTGRPWNASEIIEFKRPFIIFIMDQEHLAPLFIGRIVNPRQ
ncbi:putative alpha-1-antitrypsin-related protein [Nannospalax galili]|uniref:putative alpha-1-antitrypsin-related protein n=1 Tax=Nannospalax galili TaxID=1026970 RepID=UPI0004ED0423|nr:putative alpha-1-antitrypsin-related protein [Nannospalax galili]